MGSEMCIRDSRILSTLSTSVYCKHPYIVDVRILLKSVVCEHPYIVIKTSVPRYISYPYFEKNEIRISYRGHPYGARIRSVYGRIDVRTGYNRKSVQSNYQHPYNVQYHVRTTSNERPYLVQVNVRMLLTEQVRISSFWNIRMLLNRKVCILSYF